jgi:hypothetical protein
MATVVLDQVYAPGHYVQPSDAGAVIGGNPKAATATITGATQIPRGDRVEIGVWLSWDRGATWGRAGALGFYGGNGTPAGSQLVVSIEGADHYKVTVDVIGPDPAEIGVDLVVA